MTPRLPHLLCLLALLAGLPSAQPAAAASAVELELVLAVDASSSVTTWEFDLQMRGLAAAFRDPEVQSAIVALGDRGIAVSLVQWSGRDRQVLAVDWRHLYDAATAEAFASELDAAPRFVPGGSTAVGNAVAFSAGLLAFNAYEGLRKAIDVSGDGRTNQGIMTQTARDEAVASGVTVNGLAILNEDPSVDSYFMTNVIGGPGAFLITATDYEDFARAIRLKLLREVGGPPVADLPQGENPAGQRRRAAAD